MHTRGWGIIHRGFDDLAIFCGWGKMGLLKDNQKSYGRKIKRRSCAGFSGKSK